MVDTEGNSLPSFLFSALDIYIIFCYTKRTIRLEVFMLQEIIKVPVKSLGIHHIAKPDPIFYDRANRKDADRLVTHCPDSVASYNDYVEGVSNFIKNTVKDITYDVFNTYYRDKRVCLYKPSQLAKELTFTYTKKITVRSLLFSWHYGISTSLFTEKVCAIRESEIRSRVTHVFETGKFDRTERSA